MTAITHDQITDKIKSSALLVSLHLGRYNPVKTDRSESNKVLADHNITDPKLLKVKKHTLPTAEVLEKIEKLDNKLRSTFDKFCAPYARGVGLLPASRFLELRAALNPFLDERETLIKRLANDYTIYLDGAKRLLNGAFKESDYPAVTEVVSRFHHKLDVFPIADPRDAKLNVLGEIADSINEAVAETFKEKAESVVPYIREVLLDPLIKFSETLQNPEALFKDSLVDNVREAADRAEGLNILGDDEIVNAIYEIRQRLVCNPERLRSNPAARSEAVSNAAPIIESLGGTIPPPKVVAPRKSKGKKAITLLTLDSEESGVSTPTIIREKMPPEKAAVVNAIREKLGIEFLDAVADSDPATLQSEPLETWTPETVSEPTPLTEALESVIEDQSTNEADALLAKLGW